MKTDGNRSMNPETTMQSESDPYLSLENEACKLERAIDRASVQRNSAAAWHLHQKLLTISQAQEAIARQRTAPGAALVLSDVLALLREKENLSPCDRYGMRHLRPIMRRLKRNERRLDDLIALRVLLEMARSQYAWGRAGSMDEYNSNSGKCHR